jgi:hypothetical protein
MTADGPTAKPAPGSRPGMIDRVIEFSIKRRGLVIAAGVVLALGGAWAVWTTPLDAIPDVSENQVIVFTDWPGHTPRAIEDQVTFPLSEVLRGIEEVRSVRSSSDFNFSMIHVVFEDGVGREAARNRVEERLPWAEGRLPADERFDWPTWRRFRFHRPRGGACWRRTGPRWPAESSRCGPEKTRWKSRGGSKRGSPNSSPACRAA